MSWNFDQATFNMRLRSWAPLLAILASCAPLRTDAAPSSGAGLTELHARHEAPEGWVLLKKLPAANQVLKHTSKLAMSSLNALDADVIIAQR